MKKNRREKRAEISLALLFFFVVLLVYISFWQFSTKGMSTKCLALPPFICLFIFFHFFLFSLCVSFPYHFLFIFSSILFYATLFYYSLYIFLHVCFTWSFCFFDYCLPLLFFLCPFSFFFYLYLLLPSSPFFDVCVSWVFLLFLLVFSVWHIPGLLKLLCNAVLFNNKKTLPDGEMLDIALVWIQSLANPPPQVKNIPSPRTRPPFLPLLANYDS